MAKFILFLGIVFLGLGHLDAQSRRDSSTTEIKQQAIEMREKLNKYLADNLSEEQTKKDTGIQVTVDSMSVVLIRQQQEINELKEKLNLLVKSLQTGGHGKFDASHSANQNLMVRELVKGRTYHVVSKNQLNLYFPFDSYELSKEQKLALRRFIKSQNATTLSLAGYSDWMGDEHYNKILATSRANAVKAELSAVDLDIEIQESGSCNNNSVYNENTAKWCRRVEVVVR